ncbi:hypothetical protein [Variovorax paradoxus]|uniref:hypothetical protein n=1 Tax=Variovorax paradoxus TaxID=34073 RepID=UPI003D650845
MSEELIRRLKDELFEARHAVIELMPPAVRSVLDSHYRCVTAEDTYTWFEDVVDDLIELAEVLPPVPFYFGQRANCPLCGCGPDSPYDKGFALPEGLRMHLQGKGNARQCSAMRAAFGLARSHWDEKFHPRWSPEHEAAQAKVKARRGKEIQYLISPHVAPRLVDEGMYPGQVRDAESLAWAEARLVELGFQYQAETRVRAYIRETPNACVYADPRQSGSISFAVLLKPIQKGLSRSEGRRVPIGSFRILDGRKKDLENKFAAEVASAVKELAPPLKLVASD